VALLEDVSNKISGEHFKF